MSLRLRKKWLVDKVRIYVKGGSGGQGTPKFGGSGGNGGSVIAYASKGSQLRDIAKHETRRFIAGNGGNSAQQKAFGVKGKNMVLNVPPGTMVWNSENNKKKEVMVDLDKEGASVVLARGGKGGNVASHNYNGRKGQRRVVTLELKLIADVGLVGFPNAGKSTLLHCLSNATPKIADYPFTTLRPHIGIVNWEEDCVSLADLPGLVEGAHENVGMGHNFLRHIERTKALVFVVDIQGFQLAEKFEKRDAFQTVCHLTKELECYQPGLSTRPSVLVVNKMDTQCSLERLRDLVAKLNTHENTGDVIPGSEPPLPLPRFSHVIAASAAARVGVALLKRAIHKTHAQAQHNREQECVDDGIEF